ncbi:unnamed protein product [Cochlearia groenlandica]
MKKTKEPELEQTCLVVEELQGQIVTGSGRYDDLFAHHQKEVARLRQSRLDHVELVRFKFERIWEESFTRMCTLKKYLGEEEVRRANYLLCNKITGVFDVLGKW